MLGVLDRGAPPVFGGLVSAGVLGVLSVGIETEPPVSGGLIPSGILGSALDAGGRGVTPVVGGLLPAGILGTSPALRLASATEPQFVTSRFPRFSRRLVVSNEGLLTKEQYNVYSRIMHSIKSDTGNFFFLNAPAGTGKAFLINLLLTKVRSISCIALAVASSGIAATLLEGGRMAHSAFKLPLDLINIETPMCNIPKQSNIAKVLCNCKFINWDENTMAHKRGIEALDRSLKDIRNNNGVMGGVTVLLTGDFRQTLPVILRGSRADEVKACTKASYLWPLREQTFSQQEYEGPPGRKQKWSISLKTWYWRQMTQFTILWSSSTHLIPLAFQHISGSLCCGQGESTFIPRISFLSSNYPFKFKRLQFPIKVSFAMTINKSQGQSLKIGGIDLSDDYFILGQFYVVCSRVSSPTSLVILAPNGRTTVVYKEVL
ncbi:hypothetical protein QTP88_019385 [Uroleucon formosanum]